MYNVGDKVKVLKGNFCVGEEVYLERKHVGYKDNLDHVKYWHVISNDKSQFCLHESGMQLVKPASEAKLLLVESIKHMKQDYGIVKDEDVLKKRSWYPEGSIARKELTWLSDALYVYKSVYKELMEYIRSGIFMDIQIIHESDIHDGLPTIGICQAEGKEYLYVWYTEFNSRLYVYVELISRALLKEKDMYTIYKEQNKWYIGTWGNMQVIYSIHDDMLPMPGEYYNEGEANTS